MSTCPRRLKRSLVGVLALAISTSAISQAGEAQQEHRTQPELTGFTEYTSYESMMTYLGRVQASNTEMRLGIYGQTHLGRDLPYAVFSRPSITQPWEAWALGKPVILLAAAVHGDEKTMREAVLLLLRDFATPGTVMNEALDELTVVIVPQINPDGFSAQPESTRGNLWGLDLNRDYMKLEQPEVQAYTQNVILAWAPHLFVDGHNGGSYPYNLNYQCPSHPAPDPRITELCDGLIFPAVDRKLATEDYQAWYYQRGNETRWDVGGYDPRIGRNYGGFANMVGILFESPGGQSMEDGIRSGLLAYETVVEWARDNTELLLETVHTARVETVRMGASATGEVPIYVEYEPEDESVTYLIADWPPGSGPIREVQSDSLMKRPVSTLTRSRPWAYILPPDAEEAVELLRRHNIQVETLREAVTLDVDAYVIGEITYESIYNHEAATKLEVAETVTREIEFLPGSYVVRTGQMQGRIAAHLLEAETRDSVVYWNRMDAWLPKNRIGSGSGEEPLAPIYKLMRPTSLPTLLMR